MRIIDFHTHVYPDSIAEKATQSIRDFYDLEGDGMSGTVAQLLTQGEQAGIEKFVVLPVGLKPSRVRHINEFIVDEMAKHEEIVGFGTVHAEMEDIPSEVQYIADAGLRGIKLHPDTQMFHIDDERLFPMYEMARGRMPVMLHMGDPRYPYSRPERLRRILQLFPGLQVIGAHFGGWSLFETAYENLHDMDCMMDISSSLMFMSADDAVKLIRAYGPERLVFGSDFPLWDPAEEVKRFQALPLTGREFDLISYQNAQELLENW